MALFSQGKVIGCKRDYDINPIGRYNGNTI